MTINTVRRALVFFAGVAIDRATKLWALSSLAGGDAAASFFSLGLSFNRGISFSLFGGSEWGGAFASLAGVCLLAFLSARFERLRRSGIAMPLLWAGTLGNLADRLIYGYVIDWLYVGVYINFADVLLCAGAMLALNSLREDPCAGSD